MRGGRFPLEMVKCVQVRVVGKWLIRKAMRSTKRGGKCFD